MDVDGAKELNEIFKELPETIKPSVLQFQSEIKGAKNLEEAFASVRKKIIEYTSVDIKAIAKTKALAAATKLLTAALNGLISMAIGFAISKIISAFDAYIHRTERAIETMNDLRSAYDDADSTISNNLSTLNSMSDRYDELSKGLDAYGRNVSLSADEYKEYKDIVQQVLEISPSLITGYDEEGNAISNKNDLIRESIALMQEEQKQKAIDQVFNEKNFVDLFKGATAEYEEAQKSLDDAEMRLVSGLNVQLDQLANQADKDKFLSTVWEAIGTPINELDDLQRRGIPMLGEFGDKIEDVMEALRVSGQLDKECNELRSARILYESELKKTAVANKNFVQDLLVVPKTVDGYYNLSDTYSSIITSLANSFKLEDQDFDSAKAFRGFLRKITEGFVNQDPVILDLADLIELRDTIPAEEYASKYREFVSNIASSFGADEETIKVGFSFDPTITDDQVAEIKDTIKQRIGEIQNATDKDLVEYIDTLSI